MLVHGESERLERKQSRKNLHKHARMWKTQCRIQTKENGEVIIWLKKRASFGKQQEGEETYGRSITHPRMNGEDIKIEF